MIGMFEAAEHIMWSLQRSPSAYEYMRDTMIDLRIALVNAELKYQEMKNAGHQNVPVKGERINQAVSTGSSGHSDASGSPSRFFKAGIM